MRATGRAGTGPEAGFTLLELLVALTVFGFLMLGLAQGLRFGMTAWRRQATVAAATADFDAVDRSLRGLIARIDPGQGEAPSGFLGRPDAVSFITELPLSAGPPGGRRVAATLSVEAGGWLTLRGAPQPQARRLAAPAPGFEAGLLDGVSRLELAYGRVSGQGVAWSDRWSERAPPALVRIRLVPVGPGRPPWPDIVSAPARTRP